MFDHRRPSPTCAGTSLYTDIKKANIRMLQGYSKSSPHLQE